MSHEVIYHIAEICSKKNLRRFVVSPGSRSAPLTLAVVRHPQIETKIISDERSAGFIAMGMAQQTRNAVGLICTSGSAAYQYAPAVAEAYYQQIPLLILTADRPPEWIDQLDGQTINQREIYGKHVKESFELPDSYHHADQSWHVYRIISDAINVAHEYPMGPVHINVPLREPLYPSSDKKISWPSELKVIRNTKSFQDLNENDWDTILEKWRKYDRKLVVAGQDPYNSRLLAALKRISNHYKIPIIGDIISNLHPLPQIVSHGDMIFNHGNQKLKEIAKPQLIITFGKSIISKSLKLYLRSFKPQEHWHIEPVAKKADTYQTLTEIIQIAPETFFERLDYLLSKFTSDHFHNYDYFNQFNNLESKAKQVLQHIDHQDLSDLLTSKFVIEKTPDDSCLHLANSMSVRYANFIGLGENHRYLEVFCNRGTSGIDGSNGTAVGAAMATHKMVVLLTGDLAFFYDRNAFWHNYKLNNLRIVILNNHGGGIFGLIPGPSQQPELEEYFETKNHLTAYHTASEMGFEYFHCNEISNLESVLDVFFSSSEKPRILEVETDREQNIKTYQEFIKEIKKNYES